MTHPSFSVLAPDNVAIYPAGHTDGIQLSESSPNDYYPMSQMLQPSVAYSAALLFEEKPDGQLMARHDVIPPPVEYVPGLHCVHPSVFAIAQFTLI